ncbi:TRAP transporter fused permease subunit [Roseovarius sp. CAU 1744]|uniref:TRAP transporter permease n=1 Tax=Roseovarius sp. CAU 1744 TaxID=3140368 RepID=UPI00325B1046
MTGQDMSAGQPGEANAFPGAATSESRIHGFAAFALLSLTAFGMLVALNAVFVFPLGRFQPIGNATIYYIIGVFLSAAFLTCPARQTDAGKVPFYDWVLVGLTLSSAGYLGMNSLTMIEQGWEFYAPALPSTAACILLVMVLEGVRRTGGWILFSTAALFGLYPIYADGMPGFLWGSSYSLIETVRLHALGTESITGIPMDVVTNLVIGFVAFGAVLTVTGGGSFFMRFSMALMGKRRGGPAKVAVLSSAIMGSLSGSVISNILTTGAITIPTMKRNGYPAHYAAAVESCASTGGTLMPPVMGAVAFIMASFLGVSYGTILIAALLPAILFYLTLLLQVDCFAARTGLSGLPDEKLPRLSETLREGWPYLLSLGILIWFLLGLRIERQAPYYAALIVIAVCLLDPKRDFGLKQLRDLVLEIGRSVSHLVAILAGIGLVVGGLSYTGVAGAFSRELLLLAGGSIPLMLIAGAITSFVLGMGMTVSACYIFLSILLAPALVQAGLNPLASHLFILYWGMLSYITPPVALAAITAANLAGASSIQTGLTSLRIGAVLFVLPFLFVLEPTLILQGETPDILFSACTAVLALVIVACVAENHLYGVGAMIWPVRILLLTAAGGLVLPVARADQVGAVLLLIGFGLAWATRGRPEIYVDQSRPETREL